MKNRKNISKIAVLGATVALTAAACGSDDADVTDDPATTEVSEEAPTTDAMEEDAPTTDAMEEGAMEEGEALAPSGPLCEAVPADGEGSFDGMTDDPAGTAASNNPALSTLVAAVTAADLVDTLNSDGPFTIFAPANPAFDAFSEEELDALLADTDALTSVLTLHVVAGQQLSSADLAGMDSVTTVNGADITIAPEGDTLLINGQATVGCADVQTANATVHIIDAVLMPTDDAAMEEDAMEEDDAMEEEDGAEGEAETEEDG
ncbi:MAG: fasciclin domain-containing protein [Ilumatobacter sp.]|uniref:fasciclin domain-containing protein n=1 Tax=Ilumatobacter sp. TaxID=1967498 RepID=UPI003C7255C5